MSNVLNKTTMAYLESVDTSKYLSKADTYNGGDRNYNSLDGKVIINPDLPNCPQKYWKSSNNKVLEMSTGEKAVVDQAEVEKSRQNEAERIIQDNIMIETRKIAIAKGVADGQLNADGSLK